jgi:hypothetical protein
MAVNEKVVRQSVTLPAKVAKKVRSMAKRRRLSTRRMLVALVEEGIEVQQHKEKTFYELAEQFRKAMDAEEIEQLGGECRRLRRGQTFLVLSNAASWKECMIAASQSTT